MSEQKCAVCGMGGYWVGFDPSTRTDRCVNHIGPLSTFIHAEPQPMGSVQGDAKLSGNSGIGDGAQDHADGSE